MKFNAKAPRKKAGQQWPDLRDTCARLDIRAQTDEDAALMAMLYNRLVDGCLFPGGTIAENLRRLLDEADAGRSPAEPIAGHVTVANIGAPRRYKSNPASALPDLTEAEIEELLIDGNVAIPADDPRAQPPTGPSTPPMTSARRPGRHRRPG